MIPDALHAPANTAHVLFHHILRQPGTQRRTFQPR